MAQWLRHQTQNVEVAGLIPCFTFSSRLHHVRAVLSFKVMDLAPSPLKARTSHPAGCMGIFLRHCMTKILG